MPDYDLLIGKLDLPAKVRLLTGATTFTLAPEPEIGLAELRTSDGPTGVRGLKFSGGRTVALLPNATLLASAWSEDAMTEVGADPRRGGAGPADPRRARPDHQPAPLAPRRPAVRGLLRGPAAHRPPRRGLRPGPPGPRCRRLPQAPRRERVRDRAQHGQQRRRRGDPARALPAAVRDRRRPRPTPGRSWPRTTTSTASRPRSRTT